MSARSGNVPDHSAPGGRQQRFSAFFRNHFSSVAKKLSGSIGFADEIVHAGVEAACLVFGEGIRRHRDDRLCRTRGQGTDAAGGFEAVHARHLHVHQHEVIGAARDGSDGLLAILGDIDLESDIARAVRGATSRLTGSSSTSSTRLPLCLRRSWSSALPCGAVSEAAVPSWRCNRAVNQKVAACAGRADDARVAAHQLRQAAGDRQPEARPRAFAWSSCLPARRH